jgi:hypothetical protein
MAPTHSTVSLQSLTVLIWHSGVGLYFFFDDMMTKEKLTEFNTEFHPQKPKKKKKDELTSGIELMQFLSASIHFKNVFVAESNRVLVC